MSIRISCLSTPRKRQVLGPGHAAADTQRHDIKIVGTPRAHQLGGDEAPVAEEPTTDARRRCPETPVYSYKQAAGADRMSDQYLLTGICTLESYKTGAYPQRSDLGASAAYPVHGYMRIISED